MPAMGAFASLLQDRIKDTDYNGSFPRAILEVSIFAIIQAAHKNANNVLVPRALQVSR